VVVADVADALHRHLVDQVLANHGVHQCTSPGRQRVEALTRDGVTGQHDRGAAVFDAESDGRRDGPVIRRRHPDRHPVAVPHHTVGALMNLHRRWRGQVGVMRDPVADIEVERLERGVDHLGRARRPDDRQGRRVRVERGHPSGDDHVAQVGDVIAVQVRQQQRGQRVRAGASCRHALLHAAAAVDQKCLPAGPHEGGRPRSSGVGNGTTGAEQRDLDHDVIPTAFGHVTT
jgi:hypothetical protein